MGRASRMPASASLTRYGQSRNWPLRWEEPDMLERIDRVWLTARNADAMANRWCGVLEPERVAHGPVPELAAERVVVQVGESEVEILQPVGDGPVATHLQTGRGGVFAAGASTKDLAALGKRLAAHGVAAQPIGDRLWVDDTALGVPGLRFVLSQSRQRRRVGLVNGLYEVTHLTADAVHAARAIADTFGLNAENFVPIRSEQYGYDGSLTLFAPTALHRIETIHPFDRSKTMGRYFDRFGPSLYMCYVETDDIATLRARLERLAPNDWTGSANDDNGLFINPRALGGVMVGVSRTSYAWTWSGHPEWVRPASV